MNNTHLLITRKIEPSCHKTIIISKKEKEVLHLICEQLATKEIAHKLKVSERTITRHKQNLFEKTGAKCLVGLALFAIKYEIIDITILL